MSKKTTIAEIKNDTKRNNKKNNTKSLLTEENENKLNNDYGIKMEDIKQPTAIIPETPTVDDLTDCDKLLEQLFALKSAPTNAKQFFQIQRQQIKKQSALLWQNVKNQAIQLGEMFKNAWEALKKYVIDVCEIIKKEFWDVISYIKAEWQQLIRPFKKLKRATSEEERKKRREEIKKQAAKFGGELLEMLGILEIWETLKDLWVVLKNTWGTAKDTWNSIISNFKNLNELLKDTQTPTGKQILVWCSALLPLVAQLALVTLGAVKFAKEQQKLNNKLTEDAIKDIEAPVKNKSNSSLLDKAIKQTQEDNEKRKKEKESKKGNLTNSNNTNEENEQQDSSYFSICPVTYDTNGVVEEEYGGYIIEIANDVEDYKFTTNIGDEIKNNNILGYICNTPIKSKVEGNVKENNESYIIVEPSELTEDLDMNVETTDDNINNLISAFEDVNKIETVLNDDIFYIYKTILYNNYIDTKISETTIDYKYNNIIKTHEKNIEKLSNDIRVITNKSNVEKKINQPNGLIQIKDSIMELKKNFFNNIIKTFNSENKSIYALTTCDYELLDYYYDFIINFNYDKDNTYKVNLFNLILSFINERQEIEKFNKGEIINKFNTLATNITSNKNFFNTIKNNEKIIISNYTKNYISEQEKNSIKEENIKKSKEYIDEIYKYIKEICDLTPVEEKKYDMDNKSSEDFQNEINLLMEENNQNGGLSDEDKNTLEKDKIAKRLAILFYIYISLENKSYIKSDNLLSKLKKQTQLEYSKIIKFFKELYTIYENANKNIDNKLNNIEEAFKNVNWSIPSELYIDNKKYTHYIVSADTNNIVKTNDNNTPITDNDNNNENEISEEDGNNQLSTKTAHEPSTYMYWLRYCGMATLVNCAMPMYWATGFVLAGSPIMMPIILVPIYVFSGSCIHVIVLSICGVAIFPTLLVSNLSTNMMSYIAPINMIIDLIKNSLSLTKEKSKLSIKGMIKSYIPPIDKRLEEIKKEKQELKKEISLLKSMQ